MSSPSTQTPGTDVNMNMNMYDLVEVWKFRSMSDMLRFVNLQPSVLSLLLRADCRYSDVKL